MLSLQSWDYERADIVLVLEAVMSQIQLIIYKPAAPVNSFFTTLFNWRLSDTIQERSCDIPDQEIYGLAVLLEATLREVAKKLKEIISEEDLPKKH